MSTEKKLVVDAIKEVEETVELFYQQKTGEALKKFEGVLGEILKIVDTLYAYKATDSSFSLDEDKIKDVLTEAMQALSDNDLILLADIIQYDFVEYVKELEGTMN